MVVGDSFLGTWAFSGSDGAGSLAWDRLSPQCRYVILRPVIRGARGYVSREQVRLGVTLQAGPYMTRDTRAHVHFELTGLMLVAEAGKVAPRSFKLELEQEVPAAAEGQDNGNRIGG